MRERKYRGQRKDNGEWIYGYHFADNELNRHFIIPDFECTGGLIRTDGRYGDFVNAFVEVIPETVGEFTGKQDSKGRDIYGGDTVRLRHGTHGQWHENLVITWGEYGFFAREAWSRQQGYSLDATDIEVIGHAQQGE